MARQSTVESEIPLTAGKDEAMEEIQCRLEEALEEIQCRLEATDYLDCQPKGVAALVSRSIELKFADPKMCVANDLALLSQRHQNAPFRASFLDHNIKVLKWLQQQDGQFVHQIADDPDEYEDDAIITVRLPQGLGRYRLA